MEITDVTAFPLKKACEILKSEGYNVEIKLSGMDVVPEEASLRVARQTIRNNHNVEIVAVQSKEFEI